MIFSYLLIALIGMPIEEVFRSDWPVDVFEGLTFLIDGGGSSPF